MTEFYTDQLMPECPFCGWDETGYDSFYQVWTCHKCCSCWPVDADEDVEAIVETSIEDSSTDALEGFQ